MIARKAKGLVVIVSSAVCFGGTIGYSLYAPSKFALRGLCDCLRNELKVCGAGDIESAGYLFSLVENYIVPHTLLLPQPHNIRLVGYYPANMETPGFEVEQKTKPEETKRIEGSVSMMSADKAAEYLIQGRS